MTETIEPYGLRALCERENQLIDRYKNGDRLVELFTEFDDLSFKILLAGCVQREHEKWLLCQEILAQGTKKSYFEEIGYGSKSLAATGDVSKEISENLAAPRKPSAG